MQPLRLALLQVQTHWHDPVSNRALFAPLIESVADRSDLVVLPEMFSTGFTMAGAVVAEKMDGATVSWLRRIAQAGHVTVCGSVVINDNGHIYNRFIWTNGEDLGYYDKRHLFRMSGEHEHYAMGKVRSVFQVGDWRICPLVCYDLRFPVWFRNTNDYDALVCVANWPGSRRDAWLTLLRARAIENQVYSAGVNIVGTDGNGVSYTGGTSAYGPDGETLVERFDKAGIELITFDPGQLTRLRESFPVWRDADRFSVDTGED